MLELMLEDELEDGMLFNDVPFVGFSAFSSDFLSTDALFFGDLSDTGLRIALEEELADEVLEASTKLSEALASPLNQLPTFFSAETLTCLMSGM